MIRINLLSTRDEQRATQARIQLFLFLGVLVAEVAAMGLIYFVKSGELDKLKVEVREHKNQVTLAQKEVKDADVLKNQAETLSKQLDVLKQLELQRSGPVRVLDELQMIMSPPRDEEDRFAQLERNWNVEWDTRRLWLETLVEKNSSFEMVGAAVNADDVAEFLQRLNTAKHFQNIQLDVVQSKKTTRRSGPGNSGTPLRLVDFRLEGDLSYSGTKVEPNVDKKKRRR